MLAREAVPRDDALTDNSNPDADPASLAQQIRALQERLAFYEGFDRLIQDNVAHARELFRLAAAEREEAAAAASRAAAKSQEREVALKRELEAIAAEAEGLATAVDRLRQRIAQALAESPNGASLSPSIVSLRTMAVVIHGVPSAQTALSLRRFITSLPHVLAVSTREFAGGVLHLEVSSREPLRMAQFAVWDDVSGFEPLTERPEVIEFALNPALAERKEA